MVLAHNVNVGQRTEDVKINEDITFDTMLLSNRTLNGLKESGFYKPSPIQLHGIPLGKCGFDLLLEAKSGTGKTAVFTIIILEKLDINKGLQALILAPTREIAAQICDVIKQIGSLYKGLNVAVVMGGLSLQDDIEKFKKRVHIVVGSPGRLKHLIHDDHIDVSSVRLLVIDECDKLMEKCFLSDVNYIFSALPVRKQVIMSSATYPGHCKTFINKFVQKAQHICPNSNSILLGIAQHVTTVSYNNNIFKQTQLKFQELLKILSEHQYKQCLIFCNYQARVADVHKWLKREKWPAELLHGQQEQTHRLDALKTLQEYKCRILICTDLAARGIDASNVDLVVNFEPPFEWQTYLHRIGRAGRFGSYGIAITILSEGAEIRKFKATLKAMKLPVRLKYLWTDNLFNNENMDDDTSQDPSDTSLANDVEDKVKDSNDEIAKDLWDSLTWEDSKTSESLQSFDELHNSYLEINTLSKMEALPNLQHLEQEELQCIYKKEDNLYKFIELKEIPMESVQNGFFDAETDTELHDNLHKNIVSEPNKNGGENKDLVDSYSNEDSELNSNIELILSDRSKIDINSNVSIICKDNIQNTEKNCNIADYHQEKNGTELLHEMNKSLINGEVPTSFGREYKKQFSKPKSYMQKAIANYSTEDYHQENNETELLHERNQSLIDIEPPTSFGTRRYKKPISETKPYKKDSLRYKSSDFELDENVNSQIGKRDTTVSTENSLKHSRYKKKSHASRSDEEKRVYSSNIKKNQFLNMPRKQQKSFDYYVWYNRLKTHVRCIEYALYIEEMYK